MPRFDVLVIGAGPAGIASACAASESGCRVAVIDDNPAPGGQIWRAASRYIPGKEAAHWLGRFSAARIDLLSQTRAIDHPSDKTVLAESREGCREMRYHRLILAAGARERFLPFPGWTLPNVMGAGGLQALVKTGLPVRGKRIVLAGSGPLLVAAGAFLQEHGAQVPFIAEQTPWRRLARFGLAVARSPGKLLQAISFKWKLRGTRFLSGAWPVSADGRGRLEAVAFRSGAGTWTERCDYLGCGFGLVPNIELPRLLGCALQRGFVAVDEWQATSIPDIYAAGELTGIAGMDSALVEGEIAGYHAADRPEEARKRLRRRELQRRFGHVLDTAFALRNELKMLATPETVVCRCEDAKLNRIREHGTWRSASLQTRCGMGACQGRICGPAVEFLLGLTRESVRPPVFPARLDRLIKSAAPASTPHSVD
jgi:D-hydroxyproline dehydrogenase subunit alpha